MTHDEMVDAVFDVAAAVEGRVLEDYSGRCMYGRTCYGVAADSKERILEEAGAHGLRGAKTDNMGLGWVVYWPHIKGAVTDESPEKVTIRLLEQIDDKLLDDFEYAAEIGRRSLRVKDLDGAWRTFSIADVKFEKVGAVERCD